MRFAPFEVDLERGELRKHGIRIKLQGQPFQLLAALLERPGDLVTREELQKKLWPDGTFVDFDRGLNKAVNRLREALSDDADDPRFIETVPQRGYRFLAELESVPAPLPPPAIIPAKDPPPRRYLLAMGGGLAAVLLGAGLYLRRTPARRIESIAVLPLENLSGNPAQEYFSDGMTDELIGQIARIGSLRVISRTSIMRYKGTRTKSLPEIARELNVDAIVEGTVMQSGQKVRITAQLIRARDDRHIWSQKYERDLTGVLALQSEVARAIADKIEVSLTGAEQASFARTRKVHPEAYEAFLKGNYFLHQGIRGTGKATELFRQAIQLDPSSAEAHSGLAEALVYAGIFGLRPSAEVFPEAKAEALVALKLDDSNAAAHNALADVKKGYDWDMAGAEAEYRRALQLQPSHLLTRLWYAELLSRVGRHDESLEESRRIIALDPASPLSHNNRSMLLWRARRPDESIQEGRLTLDLDPSRVNAYWWLGMAYADKRDFPNSIASLKKGLTLNDGPLFRSLLGHVYGRAGDRNNALKMLAELEELAGKKFVAPTDFAIIYAGLGDAGNAFQWLEKAYQVRATRIHELPSPYYDGLRSDPRYADLMRRIGLPPQ